jgi:hypothetical protein
MLRRYAPRGSVRLGRSATLYSHGSLHPHFCSPGLCCAKPLFGLQKRHKQPDVMRNGFQNFLLKITTILINLRKISKNIQKALEQYNKFMI